MSADFDGDQTHCFLFVIIESASDNAPGTERERMSLAGASFPYDSARSSTGPFCRLKLSAQLIRPT